MIRVLGDRVLVALPPQVEAQDETTGYTFQPGAVQPSGIILAKPPDTYNTDLSTRGIVVQVGEKRGTVDLDDVLAVVRQADGRHSSHVIAGLERLGPASFDVDVGDMVLFPASAGEQIAEDGIDYVILHETDLLGVVSPLKREAA